MLLRPSPRRKTDRNWRMFDRRQAGETYRAIANDHRISVARVRQIVTRLERQLRYERNRLKTAE